ncbi:MAG: HEPN domain-containing protein [Candidatus Omnitrophica bacterium]|nr:HEPN domain-containing protein [Candidatus Omnitrophota bacterium]
MIYKNSIEQLLSEDLIKKCPIDRKAIENLLKRSHIDLKTAQRNLEQDEDCAYNYAYNALLRSGLALMFSQGYRPDIKNKHVTVMRFSEALLGEKFKQLMTEYDFMRKKRHRFIYEPDIPCSRKEAENAIHTAKEFVNKISEIISAENPQPKFKF